MAVPLQNSAAQDNQHTTDITLQARQPPQLIAQVAGAYVQSKTIDDARRADQTGDHGRIHHPAFTSDVTTGSAD